MIEGSPIVQGQPLAPQFLDRSCPDLVTWTFSGDYDSNKAVLIDASNPNRFLTLSSAQDLVAQLAGSFTPHSTVCLHLSNDILYPILVLATLASHCRWTGTNTAYTASELQHHFCLSETDYVITSATYLPVVSSALRDIGSSAEIILFDDLLSTSPNPRPRRRSSAAKSPTWQLKQNLRTLSSLLRPNNDVSRLRNMCSGISPDSLVILMQTSGTTGLPKMAARTHRSMIIEQHAIQDNHAAKSYEVRRLFSVPIFHGFGCPEMIFNSLRLGHATYIMKRFDDSFAQKIFNFQITETYGSPPMFLRLANDLNSHSLLQSLHMIAYGGAAMVPELKRKFTDIFAHTIRLVPVYGMTEGGWFTTLKYPEADESGSVGRPVDGCEFKVSVDKMAHMSCDEMVGELLIRTPQLMNGYLDNQAATAGTFDEGWLKTGDVGYLKDGKVYIVDRTKDLIKVNGWQVAPAEIENAALQHPGVQDATAISAGEGSDEHPLIFIVRAPGLEVTEQEVKDHLRGRLASYKVSRAEIRFVDSIPKSPSGKVLKKLLREQV